MPVGRAIGLGATVFAQGAALVGHRVFGGPAYNAGHEAVAQSQRDATANGGQVSNGARTEHSQQSKSEQLALARENIVSISTIPQRMYIQSVDRPEEAVEAQYNPEKLRENIGIDWARFNIPGLSYQPQQYGNTNNLQYRFELIFSAAARSAVLDIGDGRPAISFEAPLERILTARNQLHAWAVLSNRDLLGGLGDTQRLLFVWPNFVSLTCNLVSIEFNYEQFNVEGKPVFFRCEVLLEEVRDVAIYAEDILAQGTVRSGKARENP